MNEEFEKWFDYLKIAEGEYSNLAADHETHFGLSRPFQESIGAWNEPTKNWEWAKSIYRTHFWPRKSEEMHPLFAWTLADALVNHRPGPAKRLAQSALGGVMVDGVIGPQTRKASKALDPSNYWLNYTYLRNDLYFDIVHHRPEKIVHLKGWMNRLHKLGGHYITSRP